MYIRYRVLLHLFKDTQLKDYSRRYLLWRQDLMASLLKEFLLYLNHVKDNRQKLAIYQTILLLFTIDRSLFIRLFDRYKTQFSGEWSTQFLRLFEGVRRIDLFLDDFSRYKKRI